MSSSPLLAVESVVVRFPAPGRVGLRRRATVEALHGVSMHVGEKETVGLVGESGSGKSTLAKAILGIVPLADGTVSWDGTPVTGGVAAHHRAASTHAQLVFQDPYGSLNPMMTVGSSLMEVLRVRRGLTRSAARIEARELVDAVRLPSAALERYPSEFSGGQRQRIVIARALAARPRLLVCDEPLSALDVTTQARMIELLEELRREFGMAMLFIGHDLSVVRHLSDRMLVMYQGEVVEQGPADSVYERPSEPYTQRLVASIPVADPAVQRARREQRRTARQENVA